MATVIRPRVGLEIAPEVVLVNRAMKLVRAPLGDQLNLTAGRAVEIGGLVGSADSELFDAFRRRRHYARGSAPCRGRADEAGGLCIGVRRAGHVVAVVAAVKLIGVLISNRAGHFAGR